MFRKKGISTDRSKVPPAAGEITSWEMQKDFCIFTGMFFFFCLGPGEPTLCKMCRLC